MRLRYRDLYELTWAMFASAQASHADVKKFTDQWRALMDIDPQDPGKKSGQKGMDDFLSKFGKGF